MVYSELYGASIQEPGLIAGGVASHVEGVARPIRVNHESRNPRGHSAEGSGRNNVRCPGYRRTRCRVKAVAGSHRHTAYRCRARRVENFSLIYGSPKNVVGDHGAGIEQRTEISGLESVSRSGVAEARQNPGGKRVQSILVKKNVLLCP